MAGVISDDKFLSIYGDKQPGIISLLFAGALLTPWDDGSHQENVKTVSYI